MDTPTTSFLHAIVIGFVCTSPNLEVGQDANQFPPAPAPQILGHTGVAGLPLQPQHSAREAQAAASNPGGRSWQQLRTELLANNPTLRADALNVDEAKAQEVTAYLRPNPTATLLLDQNYPFSNHYNPNVGSSRYTPLANSLSTGNITYLHERDGKRELRLKSAQQNTTIQQMQHENLARTLIYTLRAQFVATLQAKAVLALTQEELDYYDHLMHKPAAVPEGRYCADRSRSHRVAEGAV